MSIAVVLSTFPGYRLEDVLALPVERLAALVELAHMAAAWRDLGYLHVVHGEPEKVRDMLANRLGLRAQVQNVVPGITPGTQVLTRDVRAELMRKRREAEEQLKRIREERAKRGR